MKTIGVIISLFMLTAKIVDAQSSLTAIGARTTGAGNTHAALPDDFSLFQNPAGLGMLDNSSLSVTSDRRPALPGASRVACALTAHSKIGTFSVGAFRFGDDIYSEQLLSFGYGHKLGLASLGVRADYIQHRAEGFDPFLTFGITLGTMAQITPRLRIGAYATNINRPRFPDGNALPIRMTAGFAWKPGDQVLFCGEVQKELRYEPTIKGGMELTPLKKFKVRTGFNLFPTAMYAGLGLTTWKVTIDYAITFNYALSYGHQLSLILSTKK